MRCYLYFFLTRVLKSCKEHRASSGREKSFALPDKAQVLIIRWSEFKIAPIASSRMVSYFQMPLCTLVFSGLLDMCVIFVIFFFLLLSFLLFFRKGSGVSTMEAILSEKGSQKAVCADKRGLGISGEVLNSPCPFRTPPLSKCPSHFH